MTRGSARIVFYIVLRHRAHQDPGGATIGDDHVTGHIEGVLPALAGEFIDCPARFRGRRIGDADVRPGLEPAEIRKAAFDKLLADAGARVGIGEARQHRIHPALMDPGRQQKAQRIGGGVVRILVAMNVDPARAGRLDGAEEFFCPTPAVDPGKLQMGDLNMDAAAFADVDGLGDRIVDRV